MVGLFGFLFLGGLFGANFMQDNKRAVEGQFAMKAAKQKGEEMYYDGFHNLHWTENNEILNVIKLGGVTEYIGVKSGKVYKTESSEWFDEIKSNEKKLKDGIEFCKEHGIKYFPFHFPQYIGSNNPICTGIEIETGRKYYCDKSKNGHICSLIYLEDNPHTYSGSYGKYKEYDAVHDATKEMYQYYINHITDNNIQNVRSLFSRDSKAFKNTYFTKEYKITMEEYKERTKEIDKYPYEFYRISTF